MNRVIERRRPVENCFFITRQVAALNDITYRMGFWSEATYIKFSLHFTRFECVKKLNLSSDDFEDQDFLLHEKIPR